MKAPSFWYDEKKKFLACLLSPLGILYRAGYLLRRAVTHPAPSRVPVICVGNIVVGGAGKTPTAIGLARHLIANGARPVFVTRGYGGRLQGPLRVNLSLHTATDVGDEAILLAGVAPCWIGRSRPQALRFAEKEATHIIMDDGLQNPAVAPDMNLLVVDGAVGFGNGKIFPAGPLRETLHDAFSRIAALIIIGPDNRRVGFCLGKPILQASLVPRIPSAWLEKPDVLAFAGIGRPQKFYDSCRQAGLVVVETRDFPDHHVYEPNDVDSLAVSAARRNLRLVTTLKDWVRLPEDFRKNVGIVQVDLVFSDEAALQRLLAQATKNG